LPIIKCPKGELSDIQLEAILTPLLFPRKSPEEVKLWTHTIHNTQPDLNVLDIGCGWGRLIGGLLSFPIHFTRHIYYTGCEPTEDDLQYNKRRLQKLEKSLCGQKKFKDYFAGIDFATWDKLKEGRYDFDFVYMVNVLHHVKPSEVPNLFMDIAKIVKDKGYLIIHDFFFDRPLLKFDIAKYCMNSVFFGPNHLSAFFAMASTQTGVYRKMRRMSKTGFIYDLFTFILHFDNELSKSTYEKSVWHDDYFSYHYIPGGVDACLSNIISTLKPSSDKKWFSQYLKFIVSCQSELREKWKPALQLDQYGQLEKWINQA
jgi:SAM-dependent methyltransferase